MRLPLGPLAPLDFAIETLPTVRAFEVCALSFRNVPCCSPLHFYRLGIAHIILLGLLPDFWKQWLPGTKDKVVKSADGVIYQLPGYIRTELSRRSRDFPSIKSISKQYKDIVKCVLWLWDSVGKCPLRLRHYKFLLGVCVRANAGCAQAPRTIPYGAMDGLPHRLLSSTACRSAVAAAGCASTAGIRVHVGGPAEGLFVFHALHRRSAYRGADSRCAESSQGLRGKVV